MIHAVLALLLAPSSLQGAADPNAAALGVDLARVARRIDPRLYGTNDTKDRTIRWTLYRFGGNSATPYNWETNFDNAGKDYRHNSGYGWSTRYTPEARRKEPAAAIAVDHEAAQAMGAETLVQVNLTGFVAADGNGPVSESEAAPSARWKRFVFRKGKPFQDPPDTTDGAVYLDEMVSHFVKRYGPASSKTGIQAYSLDNEPELWGDNHVRSHPAKTTCRELIERSVTAARAIKAVDPTARIHGPNHFGVFGYEGLVAAPDWPEVKRAGGYRWFLDAYLDAFAKASKADGKRLLDVLDLHYYAEDEIASAAGVDGTLQAPRYLWDPAYRNPSWLGEVLPGAGPLLPNVRASIDRWYPGTKLCFSEYNPGEIRTWQGGLALVDMLGAFGRHGVDMATFWSLVSDESPDAEKAPYRAAFRLLRDYDGKGGVFGDEARDVANPMVRDLSAWAATDGATGDLHLLLVSKRRHLPLRVTLPLPSGRFRSAEAYGFDAEKVETRPMAAPTLGPDGMTLDLPKKTALHVVLRAAGR